MVVATCLLQLNWPTSFSLMKNYWFTCSVENRHGRTLNQPALESFPHRGLLFLQMKGLHRQARFLQEPYRICLLYTSDAADEEDSVDLGGRRLIKKKKQETKT